MARFTKWDCYLFLFDIEDLKEIDGLMGFHALGKDVFCFDDVYKSLQRMGIEEMNKFDEQHKDDNLIQKIMHPEISLFLGDVYKRLLEVNNLLVEHNIAPLFPLEPLKNMSLVSLFHSLEIYNECTKYYYEEEEFCSLFGLKSIYDYRPPKYDESKDYISKI